jgi:hypothetical protein
VLMPKTWPHLAPTASPRVWLPSCGGKIGSVLEVSLVVLVDIRAIACVRCAHLRRPSLFPPDLWNPKLRVIACCRPESITHHKTWSRLDSLGLSLARPSVQRFGQNTFGTKQSNSQKGNPSTDQESGQESERRLGPPGLPSGCPPVQSLGVDHNIAPFRADPVWLSASEHRQISN